MFSRGVIYMGLATLCFSWLSVCVKFLHHIPAHELILFRAIISIFLSLGYIKSLKINPFGNNKRLLVIRGIWGTAALTVFFIAVQNIPLATAATLQYSAPIFTAFFGIFYLKEKIRNVQWASLAVAFSGVLLINGLDTAVNSYYLFLALCSGIFSGIAYVVVRKLKDTDHPAVIVFYFPFIAVPIMSIWCFFDWKTPHGTDWILIILIGLLTQAGQILMTKALQQENAGRITSIQFIGTINAFIFSLFIFHEKYSIYSIIGMLLVTSGVLMNIYITAQKKTNAKATSS
jgi:drug/metabolite transporter (DMT)-like permease